MRERGKEEEMISQHRSNPQINHRCALCKHLNIKVVSDSIVLLAQKEFVLNSLRLS